MAIVADFESYPQWNDEVRAVCVLARCGDGHYPSRTEAEVHESAHKTWDGSASDIDSGNRGLEGDDDGSPETLVPGEVMETGCCTRASGVELKRFLSSADLAELMLGPFGIQRNRPVT